MRSIKQRLATIMGTTCAPNIQLEIGAVVSTVKLRFRFSPDRYRVSFVIRFKTQGVSDGISVEHESFKILPPSRNNERLLLFFIFVFS